MSNPLISIITVSFNAVSTIEKTILSVINQTYPNIEYIIIDGGSTDGTVDVIKKYSDKITYWISELDKGIYDAMNKGTDVASGEWINFMNSGDTFYCSSTISDTVQYIQEKNIDVVYGNRILSFAENNFLQRPDSLTKFNEFFPIFHQSTFVKTNLMKGFKYDLKFKICSDYSFFHTLWKNMKTFYYIDIIISICDCEYGVSSQYKNEYKREKENLIIQNKLSDITSSLFLIKIYLKSKLKSFIHKLFPHYLQKYRLKQFSKTLASV